MQINIDFDTTDLNTALDRAQEIAADAEDAVAQLEEKIGEMREKLEAAETLKSKLKRMADLSDDAATSLDDAMAAASRAEMAVADAEA